jgi:hypothetical protein
VDDRSEGQTEGARVSRLKTTQGSLAPGEVDRSRLDGKDAGLAPYLGEVRKGLELASAKHALCDGRSRLSCALAQGEDIRDDREDERGSLDFEICSRKSSVQLATSLLIPLCGSRLAVAQLRESGKLLVAWQMAEARAVCGGRCRRNDARESSYSWWMRRGD